MSVVHKLALYLVQKVEPFRISDFLVTVRKTALLQIAHFICSAKISG